MMKPWVGFSRLGLARVSRRALGSWQAPEGARVDAGVVARWDELTAFRRDLHRHPELGLQETRTAGKVAKRLRDLGLEVHEGVGGTGVVGVLQGCGVRVWKDEGENDGVAQVHSIGLRADMDCLPITERGDVAHHSQTPGLMHACGHDGHTTMLLGAAQHLSENREQFSGTVHFFFQPAEEQHGGARLMIEDGAFRSRFQCDEVYGVHNWPYLEPGKISIQDGPIMAGNDEFDIVIRGRGGHAALPHLSADPIVVASQLVTSLQSIVSRSVDPIQSGVLSVTQINGGSAYNVIPDTVTLKGTIRTFREVERESIIERLELVAKNTCEAHGVKCEVFIEKGYPATVNSKEQCALAWQAAEQVVSPRNVVSMQPTMGSEDFSYMLKEVPGCYAWIGAGAPTGAMLHEDTFDFDDNITPLGVQYFCNIIKLRLPAEGV